MQKPRKNSGSYPRPGESGRQSTRGSDPSNLRHQVAVAMMVFGVVVFLQHFISHFVGYAVIAAGADDVLIGHPTAAVLGIGGLMMLGPEGNSNKTRRR